MLNYVFSYLLALGQRVSGYKSTGIMTGETIPKPLSCLTATQAKSWFLAGWPPVLYLPCISWAKPLWPPSLRPSPYSHGHWSYRKLYPKNVNAYRTFKAPLNPVLTKMSKYLTALTRSYRSAQRPRYDTVWMPRVSLLPNRHHCTSGSTTNSYLTFVGIFIYGFQ